MFNNDLYTITEPSEWAKKPSIFSYSALQAIKKCPLQWQLLHSKYGTELRRFPARPAPAAVEGNIIHVVLEKLFRALSLIGLPAIGTSDFSECVARVNIKKEVNEHILLHDNKIAKHPRGSGFRLRSSPQQLVNKIIRLFRQQYSGLSENVDHQLPVVGHILKRLEGEHENCNPVALLKKYNVLSEYRIDHLTLPFMGVIDFVFMEDGQTIIVDFKTGKESEGHLDQVMIYALLWKSQTGQLPRRLEVRYPHIVESVTLDGSALLEEEKQLSVSIDEAIGALSTMPAEAHLNAQCLFCDVRQFCGIFWKNKEKTLRIDHEKEELVDVELTVVGVPTAYGFEGTTSTGKEVAIVFSDKTTKLQTVVQEGTSMRILSALVKGSVLRVLPRTEFYFT